MKCLVRVAAACVLLIGAPFSAIAAEETISFDVGGQKVVGTLETPDGVSNPPVVLMLHGFTGTRNELPVKDTEEGVFERTARQLADKGYASLRIDFRGSGDSDGAWADTTFSGQITDAVAAIDWLKASDAVDGSRIAVLGWSQGGLVAAHAVNERADVEALILWAPAVNPMNTFGAIVGAEVMAKALTDPADTEITVTLPWGVDTTLKAAFYQEMPLTSTVGAVARYSGPMLVIVGAKDTVVTPQPQAGQVLLDYHDGEQKIAIFETGHVWGAFEGPQIIDEKMVPETLQWLDAHL